MPHALPDALPITGTLKLLVDGVLAFQHLLADDLTCMVKSIETVELTSTEAARILDLSKHCNRLLGIIIVPQSGDIVKYAVDDKVSGTNAPAATNYMSISGTGCAIHFQDAAATAIPSLYLTNPASNTNVVKVIILGNYTT